MTADQVVWSEQSRLHLSYVGTVATAGDTNGTFTVVTDIDGSGDGDNGFAVANHGVRVNDIVLIATAGIVTKALVVETPASAVITVEPYDKATLAGHATTGSGSVLYIRARGLVRWLLAPVMVDPLMPVFSTSLVTEKGEEGATLRIVTVN